jgi:hypothetical protein
VPVRGLLGGYGGHGRLVGRPCRRTRFSQGIAALSHSCNAVSSPARAKQFGAKFGWRKVRFPIEVTRADVAAGLSLVTSLVGARVWTERFWQLRAERERSPHFEAYRRRFALETALEDVLRYRKSTGHIPARPRTPAEERLWSFLPIFARVHDRLSSTAQASLVGQVVNGLKSNNGLGPVAYELSIAAFLVRRGFDIEFQDYETGGGFDFLVSGPAEAEVECKHVSGDLGRQIHQSAMVQLESRIRPLLLRLLTERGSGHLKAVIPARLIGDGIQDRAIAEAIKSLLEHGLSCLTTESVRLELSELPVLADPDRRVSPMHALAEQLGPSNSHHVVVSDGTEAAAFTVQSARPDKVLGALVDKLKDDFKRQFSGSRPGMLCVHVPDLSSEDLEDLAREQRIQATGIQAAISYLLTRRPSLHTVAVTVDGQLVRSQRGTGVMEFQGSAYVVRNSRHPQAENPALQVFQRR